MDSRNDLTFIKDIAEAIQRIEKFTQGMDQETFAQREVVVRAVLYELSVIGEAARKISDNFRKEYEQIPWKQIWDMRNRLIHDYTGVDYGVVWKTVSKDIPALKIVIEEISRNFSIKTANR